MAESVYIHIPFCKSKCKYCSFVSFPSVDKKERYLDKLISEINTSYKGESLKTLYFGGGTPSLLSIEEFKKLISLFKTTSNTEITAELNPETLTQKYMTELREIGVNRVSIGCQTFDDEILRLIGRRHNSNDVKNAVSYAKNAGFDNISLDFIYGLPNQTIKGFENDLKQAIAAGVQHISLYGLKIDEGCYFSKNHPRNLPDENVQADMYLKAVEVLKDYEHYEFSNFGIPSKHNLVYWNNENYYGLGISAHGYLNNVRYSNSDTLEKYFEKPRAHEILLTPQQQLEEEIFLGFRKMSGININKINKKFNIDFEKKYSPILEKYKDFFVRTPDGYSLNINGVLISNSILSEFLD